MRKRDAKGKFAEKPPFISIGQRFERLTVIGTSRNKFGHPTFVCRCDCGNEVASTKLPLVRGQTKSCGCWLADRLRVICKTQEFRDKFTKHGLCNRPEYGVWNGMNQRCTNPNDDAYPHYGGRGIIVCKAWRESFESFFADMGPRPSPKHHLGRINNDKGYSPKNCAWQTRKENARNTRRARLITMDGVTKNLAAWAEERGVGEVLIHNRIKAGWSVEDAIKTPRKEKDLTPGKGSKTARKHGHSGGHGTCRPEYAAWASMISRCTNSKNHNYHRYGGRRIKVCKKWRESYVAFFKDVGPRPSVDHQLGRLDNDGNYEPGNAAWQTRLENSRNKRTNHYLIVDGVKKTISEWTEIKKFPRNLIKVRLTRGWTPERAVNTPRNPKLIPRPFALQFLEPLAAVHPLGPLA